MLDFMKAVNVIFRYKTFSPDDENEKYITAVDGVSLSIQKGDFVGILGHNGSGKSTLAKQLAGLLTPTEGYVYVDGLDTRQELNSLSIRKTAGIVFQNPDNQLIGNVVEEDIAFGPENLGLPREEIWTRVADALEATGMTAYRFHSPRALSGGQKQKIAISGILAMEPECIILDEPTAMLDPQGRREVMEAIHKLNKEKKISIILITHHMEEVEDADDLYVMKNGKVMAHGRPKDIWSQHELLKDCGIGLPFDRQLAERLESGKIPDRIYDAGDLARSEFSYDEFSNNMEDSVSDMEDSANMEDSVSDMEDSASSEICFKNVSYAYKDQWQEETRYALKDISFSIKRGDYVAIIGKTGSGKSTLLQHLNGLLKATEGVCYFNGKDMHGADVSLKKIRQKVALCFQYPEYQLFEETVLKDICFGPSNLGYSEEDCIKKARNAMVIMGLSEELEQVSPFSLSGGQKRRVALAGILAMEPDFLVLDEPVAGMDQSGKDNLFALLRELNEKKHVAIVLVSHDMDDVAAHARRVMVMDEGQIVMDGPVRDIFGKKEEFEALGMELPHAVAFYNNLRKNGQGEADRLPLTVEELAEYIMTKVKDPSMIQVEI